MTQTLPLDLVLEAYARGLFPMAESAESRGFLWYDAPRRGVFPLETFHVPARLRRVLRRADFEVRVDTDFAGVVEGCAAPGKKRERTWINRDIAYVFNALHRAGHAHSVECWRDGDLVGGIYGLAFGAVFCGESMFSRKADASKIALVHLAARLWRGGFRLFDTQLVNPHLQQFGIEEMESADYRLRLASAREENADFRLTAWPGLTEQALLAAYLSFLSAPAER